MDGGERVQKVLARAGIASRRAAEELIRAGRVVIDGTRAELGQRVAPGAEVRVDGRVVTVAAEHRTFMLHKPRGVITTAKDERGRGSVLELLPDVPGLHTVGRLDRDSEGLLLLTNDGDWAQLLLHPRHGVEREYAVGLRAPLDPDARAELEAGVRLEEGIARLSNLRPASRTEAARLDARGAGQGGRGGPPALAWYYLVLRQGWKRQVRRMFVAAGVPVERLVRTRIGSLRLSGLPAGEVRPLTSAERQRLASEASGGPVISIDGPASSGKSSVGAAAALRLGFRFLDTGVLYRALAWLCAVRGVDADDEPAILALVPELELVSDEEGRLRRVRIRGRDVTDELHGPAVDRLVSRVARLPRVRAALLPLQRRVAQGGRIIVAGRDIGSVVLPDADLKLYLQVSLEERARRRAADRDATPGSQAATEVLADLRRRDEADSTRLAAPLRVPEDASVVRSDGREFEETVEEVVRLIRSSVQP
jgi:23S rRNA pseudouridine2605 synthase